MACRSSASRTQARRRCRQGLRARPRRTEPAHGVAKEGTMKSFWLVIPLASSLAVTAMGFAQMTTPQVQGSPAEQMQHMPVSDLHMGVPSQMKNPYEGDRDAWMQGKKLFQSLNCTGCHAAG